MSKASPAPAEINLNRSTRELEVAFDDGSRFTYPCEYLRVFSPAAEVKAARGKGGFIRVKEDINIERISLVGGYAVQLVFSDNHDTGIYSWKTLYELGEQFQCNWSRYLQWKKTVLWSQGLEERKVEVLYFTTLAQIAHQEREMLVLSNATRTVGDLLSLLSERDKLWAQQLDVDKIKVTINKQFVTLDQDIYDGDEIALVP